MSRDDSLGLPKETGVTKEIPSHFPSGSHNGDSVITTKATVRLSELPEPLKSASIGIEIMGGASRDCDTIDEMKVSVTSVPVGSFESTIKRVESDTYSRLSFLRFARTPFSSAEWRGSPKPIRVAVEFFIKNLDNTGGIVSTNERVSFPGVEK